MPFFFWPALKRCVSASSRKKRRVSESDTPVLGSSLDVVGAAVDSVGLAWADTMVDVEALSRHQLFCATQSLTEEQITRIALHKKKNPAMKQKLSAAVHFLQRFGRDTPAQRKPA